MRVREWIGGLTAFSLILWGPPPLQAGIENRPLNTDDGYTLDQGAVSISVGSVFTQAHNKDKQIGINADVGFGVTDRFEISADFPYAFLYPKSGSNGDAFGDISIRPELNLLKESDSHPALSIAGTVKFDNGNDDKNLGSGAVDYSLSLQASKAFKPITLHLNGGVTFAGEPTGAKRDNVISYNVAGEIPIGRIWTLVGELFGQTNPDPAAADDPLEWLVGFTYTPRKGVILDAGMGTGLTDASPDLRVTGGVTVVF